MPNKLAAQKSPYLLQHAKNPVDWYPWSEEAFEKAGEEDKPVFLSIGYSTCHWCHVMAHESFEDAQVARLMNDTFVPVKVDREERPDIDSIYMTVCQMMTGSGGWPLTILMTPDKKPFFAATYIPKENRFGHIGMLELVPRIKDIWASRKKELLESAETITAAVQQAAAGTPGEELSGALLSSAYEGLAARFDPAHGGFGTAPKFPTPHNMLFLLRYWQSTGEEMARQMVEQTLQAMQCGGIFDHVGFGFHRYATDREWLVPHFEKMLYDQAMLLMTCTEAFQATAKPVYEQTARRIVTYVLRDMTAPEGGFYSAEDADSEGVEGKFYVWTEDEIRQVLGEQADFVIRLFNVSPRGNYREEATQKETGQNILHLNGFLSEEDASEWETARQKLFAHREKRVHPHKDDKVLTDWNGLMIAALAKAAQAFDEPDYAEAAMEAVNFILKRMRTPDGRLLHRYREDEAAIVAYADDYAFLVWGLLELYEATFEAGYLENAIALNQVLIEHYWDEAGGGFFTTPDDGETLFARQKAVYDGAIPSANSVAMLNLLRLGRMTADAALEEKAAELGKAFTADIKRAPLAYTQLMCALSFALASSQEIIIAGPPGAADTNKMLRRLRARFIPDKVVLFNPTDEQSPRIHQLAAFTQAQTAIDGQATAYVCRNHHCQLPTFDPGKMLDLLENYQFGN